MCRGRCACYPPQPLVSVTRGLRTPEEPGASDRLSPGPRSWPGPQCWPAARSGPFSGHGLVSFTDSLFSIRFLLSPSESLQPTNSALPSVGGGGGSDVLALREAPPPLPALFIPSVWLLQWRSSQRCSMALNQLLQTSLRCFRRSLIPDQLRDYHTDVMAKNRDVTRSLSASMLWYVHIFEVRMLQYTSGYMTCRHVTCYI